MIAVFQLVEASRIMLIWRFSAPICSPSVAVSRLTSSRASRAMRSARSTVPPCRQVTLTGSSERILQAVDPRHDLRAQGCEVILSGHLVLDSHQRAPHSLEGIVAHSCQYGLP
jgi:hypothetical protein